MDMDKDSKKMLDFETIEGICSVVKKVTAEAKARMLKTSGTMNIAEIMNRHHLENQHSDIIGFLLDPNEKHHHPEYGAQFLSLLKENGLGITGDKIVSVEREDSTDEARRMDLFLTTKKDCIIIENKIYAGDQNQQIADYAKFVEEKFGATKNVFVVYLTLFGKEPSESSLSEEQLARLKAESRFVNVSYAEGILSWLEGLETKREEKELNAALIQYIDVVKGLTNQRQEVFNMNEEMARELMDEYGSLNRGQLREKMELLYSFENNIKLVLFTNFFEDVYNGAIEKAGDKMHLFCNGNFDYKTVAEWKEDVAKFQNNFGVRYNDIDRKLTVDLFVSDLNANRFVFGFISDDESADFSDDLKDYGTLVREHGYNTAAIPGSWFVNAILAKDFRNGTDWEIYNKTTLATHVVENWFVIE